MAERFRIAFLLRDGLQHLQVVPLVPANQRPSVNLAVGGTLVGVEELRAFITSIGIDSIVRTQSLPPASLEVRRDFIIGSPQSIVSQIVARVQATAAAQDKILDGEKLNAKDEAVLSPLEHFVLGATCLDSAEGVRRVRSWFDERDRPGP